MERLRPTSGSPVCQAKVGTIERIVRSRVDGLCKRRDRLLELSPLEIYPAEGISDFRRTTKARTRDQRQLQRIVEPSVRLIDPREVVRGDRRGGVAHHDLLILPFRLVAAPRGVEDLRDQRPRCGGGIALSQPTELGERRLEALLREIQSAEEGVRGEARVIGRDDACQHGYCAVEIAQGCLGLSGEHQQRWRSGLEPQRAFNSAPRLGLPVFGEIE